MKKLDISTPRYPTAFAFVDDEDFAWLSNYNYHVENPPQSRTMYAARDDFTGGKRKSILMHRDILHAQKGEEVDHRDTNGLNNQKENLRKCSHKQNTQNRQLNKNSVSGFKGVTWSKNGHKWRVRLGSKPNRRSGGSFTCLIKAAKASDALAKEMYGEFAWLNFPKQ